MPRVTKVMLENRITGLEIATQQLRNENEVLRKINELLSKQHFDVEGFCGMHREAVTAIAHVVTDLKEILRSRNL